MKIDDPQIVVVGQIKHGKSDNELIVFSIPLGPIELVCIVPIPDEGRDTCSVYIKIKTKSQWARANPHGG